MIERNYINREFGVLVLKRIKGNIRFIGALLAFLPVAVALLVSQQTYAQSTETANIIKVSPVRSDIEIAPGQSKTIPVTVTNLTNSTISVVAIANDFVAGDDRGTPALILDADKFAPSHSLKRFMSPIPTTTIAAGQAKTINVVITVPATAQAGGYFGAIRFAPSTPDSGGQVNLSASVASLMLLTVPGDTVEKLTLNSFEGQQDGTNGTFFNTPDNHQVAFSFENSGNVQIGPFGLISVKNGKDVVYTADFNDNNPRDMILPDSTRRWEVPLEDIGTFGYYEVTATFTYGTKNQTIEVTKGFWVVPLSYIIWAGVALLVLIGLIVLIVWLVIAKKRRRRMLGRSRSRF